MESPNRMALDLVDEAIDFADVLDVGVHHLEDDAAVLDFGIDYPGGIEAGLLLSEVATGGLATVRTRLESIDDVALPHVEVSTDHPVLSLLGCQFPDWEFEHADVRAQGSGPAQLFRRRGHDEDRLTVDSSYSRYREEFDFAVLAVETDRLPDETLVGEVAATAGVPTSGVFVLAAPSKSVAGGIAAAARVAERAVIRFDAAGYDPRTIQTVDAVAPVAPRAGTEAEARVRSAAAVAGGGRVHLVVDRDVDDPESLVRRGSDDALPPPAQVTVDVAAGPTHVVGGVDERRVAADLGL